jgi:hypothetical protein
MLPVVVLSLAFSCRTASTGNLLNLLPMPKVLNVEGGSVPAGAGAPGQKLKMAGATGLEPATSAVTGQRSEPIELRPLAKLNC